MTRLLATVPLALPPAAGHRAGPGDGPGTRQPVPAQPQRGHHQQRRGQGRHRLHHPHRRLHAAGHAPASASAPIVSVYFGSRTAMAFGRDVRSAIFRKVMSFSQKETNVFGTPSLITRNTNDVQQVQMVLIMAFNVMIMAPIMLVGGIIMALREDVPLSGLLIVIVPLVALVMGTIATRAMPLFRSMQKRTDRINQVMRETLSGMRVIRAFVRTDHEEARLRRGQPRPHRHRAAGQPPLRDDDPVPLRDHEPLDRGDRLVRRAAHRLGRHADRQSVRLPAVRHADPLRGHDGGAHVRHGSASGGLRRADPAGPRLGGGAVRPGRAGGDRRTRTAWSSSTRSSSATPAPRSRSCATSRSRPGPGRPRPSSAAPAPARRR